jgi:DEAD/DEAH box helicase domain-containing protein
MDKRVVLDLETQKDIREVGGSKNYHLLKISVAGIYDYSDGEYKVFEEEETPLLDEILRKASLIIGFNIKHFDFAVLRPYVSFDLAKVPYLDIMEVFVKRQGYRIGLGNLARATLGEGKSGDGLQALELWRLRDMETLKNYCLDDVRLTRELYEYGLKHKRLYFRSFYSFAGKSSFPVNWT